MVQVKDFIAGHHRHQILRLTQVDDVVGPAGNHVNSLDFIPGNLKLHRFPGVDIPFLNQAVTGDHNEKLPLGVVPVLPLGDARTADVDAHLSTVGGMHQFSEGATVVHVHFEGVLKFVRRQIGQVQGVQLLGKRAIRHFRHHKCSGLCLELLQQVNDFAQCDLVGHRNTTIAAIFFQDSLHTVKLTVLFFAFQQVEHPFYQVIDVQQFQLGTAVVDSEWLVIGDCPAEGTDGTVVLGAAVSHQVHETVNRNLSPSLLSILEEQFLASLLAAAILAVAEATSQSCPS